LDYLVERLKGCLPAGAPTSEPHPAVALEQEAAGLLDDLKGSAALEQDAVEASVDLFDRIEQLLSKTCLPLTARDQALTLIARSHATDSK
jgi:hypothetical protein